MDNKRIKYLPTAYRDAVQGCDWIRKHCNNGTISGSKLRKYWKWDLVVLCGDIFYNVTDKPEVYYDLAYWNKKFFLLKGDNFDELYKTKNDRWSIDIKKENNYITVCKKN